MVQLAHIFKNKKDKDKEKNTDYFDSSRSSRTSFSASRTPSVKSPIPSPTKSSPTKSPSKSSKNYFSHSRSSSTSGPTNFRFSRSSRDLDTHPLNLPPDELRRRLSAMAASKEDQRSSMDIDTPEVQQPNGVNGKEEDSPTPPPHQSTAASADEADSFKLAGNKFFKDGNYRRAIEEYNKGMEILPQGRVFGFSFCF